MFTISFAKLKLFLPVRVTWPNNHRPDTTCGRWTGYGLLPTSHSQGKRRRTLGGVPENTLTGWGDDQYA